MQIEIFKYRFRDVVAVMIGEDHALFRKPLRLVNLNTGHVKKFKQLDDALKCTVKGKTVADYIEALNSLAPALDGGRGGSSGMDKDGEGNEGEEEQRTFKFNHAPQDAFGEGEGGNPVNLPARINVRVPNADKSPERVLEEFRKLHALSNTEFGVTVDEFGFVTQYINGGATSVSITGRKGEMVYHNHPGGGAFSDSDLLHTAMTREKGIVASGKNGDYIFVKTNHFKPEAFSRAVKNARMKGKDYDDAVDKWLTKNQKKFGYTYVFKSASNRS